MGDFQDAMNRYALRIDGVSKAVFADASTSVHNSVVFGSEVTGAPGQPVDTAALRGSWIPKFLDDFHFQTTTKSPYAPQNEDGIARPGGGPYRLRSAVGGRWSVALTVAGWPRIVAASVAKVRGR